MSLFYSVNLLFTHSNMVIVEKILKISEELQQIFYLYFNITTHINSI